MKYLVFRKEADAELEEMSFSGLFSPARWPNQRLMTQPKRRNCLFRGQVKRRKTGPGLTQERTKEMPRFPGKCRHYSIVDSKKDVNIPVGKKRRKELCFV